MKKFFALAFVVGYSTLVPLCIAAPAPMSEAMGNHGRCSAHELAHHFGVYESVSTSSPAVHFVLDTLAILAPISSYSELTILAGGTDVASLYTDSFVRKKEQAWMARHEQSPPRLG